MKKLLLISVFLSTIFTCSSPTKTYTPTAKGQVRSGWRYYERNNYPKALEKFLQSKEIDETYSPAYNGLIWTYLQMDSMERAENIYSGIEELTIDSAEILFEAQTGILIISSLSDEFTQVISIFEANTGKWPGFVFAHSTDIDEIFIRKHAALAYYRTKN